MDHSPTNPPTPNEALIAEARRYEMQNDGVVYPSMQSAHAVRSLIKRLADALSLAEKPKPAQERWSICGEHPESDWVLDEDEDQVCAECHENRVAESLDVPTQTPSSAGLSVEEIARAIDPKAIDWDRSQLAKPSSERNLSFNQVYYRRALDARCRAYRLHALITEHVRTVLEAEIPDLLERGGRGETLTNQEQSAWTGYELGWRDGYRTRVKSLTEQRDKAVEGIKKALGAPWIAVDILRATIASIKGEDHENLG